MLADYIQTMLRQYCILIGILCEQPCMYLPSSDMTVVHTIAMVNMIKNMYFIFISLKIQLQYRLLIIHSYSQEASLGCQLRFTHTQSAVSHTHDKPDLKYVIFTISRNNALIIDHTWQTSTASIN